jgi:hypothetical protein
MDMEEDSVFVVLRHHGPMSVVVEVDYLVAGTQVYGDQHLINHQLLIV